MAGTSPSPLRRGRYPDVIEDPATSAAHGGPHFAEFSTLTNTILLAGPPGSGKSSTIHACAEELGWEVFEVHPGIGKRSGGSISSLIGDVGKNHHVGRRGVSSTNNMKRGSSLPGFGYLDKGEKGDSTHSEGGKGAIRQSVILLDEVDVLFKEDANFWPTVVNIIKFSHRPIFMTCTDISLVPQDDLPLQTCLYFTPCPSPLAVSFLQCVCLAEGHFVPREQVENTYARTYPLMSCDEPDMPSVPYPSQPPPCSDVRHALNNLQFWCSRDVGTRKAADDTRAESEVLTGAREITPGLSSLAEILADWSRPRDGIRGNLPEERASMPLELDRMEQHAASASFIDGYLERRPADVLEVRLPAGKR
ncbi:hypothetical protein JB92DRAFT_2713298 [Gautieria morchelliformis]|nr:hypothetical protein JB92DRAFT_2713298 [Gautieria morchelliformis]